MKYLLKILLSIVLVGFSLRAADAELLIDHVKKSIENASNGKSQLTESILKIDGMSSSKGRHLLNNVCSLSGARYLEIGVYRGSTFVAALYGNTDILADAVAIDNWSEFGFQKDIFLTNTNEYLPQGSFRMYEQNSFAINVKAIFPQPINIYFYDGNHSADAQRKAFTHFNSILADTFIAIVDDWNWHDVQLGTKQAFKELGYTVLFEQELPALVASDRENWWNGMYIAVIQKHR